MSNDYFDVPHTLIILPSHPYAMNFEARLIGYPDGSWVVKWRDFETYKQDQEFSSHAEAMAFLDRLMNDSCKPQIWEGWNGAEELKDADDFWKSLWASKRDETQCNAAKQDTK